MWEGGAQQHTSVLLSCFPGQHLQQHTAEGTELQALGWMLTYHSSGNAFILTVVINIGTFGTSATRLLLSECISPLLWQQGLPELPAVHVSKTMCIAALFCTHCSKKSHKCTEYSTAEIIHFYAPLAGDHKMKPPINHSLSSAGAFCSPPDELLMRTLYGQSTKQGRKAAVHGML